MDFLFLNPEVNKNCTKLQLGVAYCIQPVGSIATYSGYTQTTTARITVAPANFSSVNTVIGTPTNSPGFVASSTSLPMAPGTVSGCESYRNYDDKKGVNTCSEIASLYLVSTADLIDWNPSLSPNSDDCCLKPGYSYCVGMASAT